MKKINIPPMLNCEKSQKLRRKTPKIKTANLTSLSDVENFAQHGKITSGNVNTHVIRISAHHLKWSWYLSGSTSRKPDKIAQMRGWKRKIWHNWKGATIIVNPKKLEIWTSSRPYKNTLKMIYSNWARVDMIAREFSQFAQIAIRPIPTHHPGDLQTGEFVVEDKPFSALLKPYKDREDSRKVGLVFDSSHPGKAEFTGKVSAEGGIGLDWWLLDFPKEHRAQMLAQAEYNANIKLHLSVLGKMAETLENINKSLDKIK